MKSELELKNFYNVDFGKTYRIFNSHGRDWAQLVGRTFHLERGLTDKHGDIDIRAYDGTKYELNVLDDYDYKEVGSCSLLTPKEKEYLSNVINPFRNRVISISKLYNMLKTGEAIAIHVESDRAFSTYSSSESIYLPYFKAGTMYKTLVAGEQYTLEDLGL